MGAATAHAPLFRASRFAKRPPDERRRATEALITAEASDVDRWSMPENLMTSWAERARVAADLVPAGSRLLDIGCGAMDLERFLDASVTYVPADIVMHDDRTLLCDLNAGELPQTPADVISLLGVVEYVHNVPALFAALRGTGAKVIVSYNPVELADPGCDRRAEGWFNDFTSSQLCAMAAEAGFRVVETVTIGTERIYEMRPA